MAVTCSARRTNKLAGLLTTKSRLARGGLYRSRWLAVCHRLKTITAPQPEIAI
jgi:hypothetical protein